MRFNRPRKKKIDYVEHEYMNMCSPPPPQFSWSRHCQVLKYSILKPKCVLIRVEIINIYVEIQAGNSREKFIGPPAGIECTPLRCRCGTLSTKLYRVGDKSKRSYVYLGSQCLRIGRRRVNQLFFCGQSCILFRLSV